MIRKKGQIWIETVLYTLIGLALIGIILAIATPKINESKDRIVVEQTIDSLGVWDTKINEVLDHGPANVRTIPSFLMKRGDFYIDASADKIFFRIEDLSKPYSEPGVEIEVGALTVISEEEGRYSSVQITLDYSNATNITFEGRDALAKFTAAAVPYSFRIENRGGENITEVRIEETSR